MRTYEEAHDLFKTWTQSESLTRHAYGVEAGMKYYARQFGEDVELWRMTGLLHDMDYEKHPTKEEHPFVGVKVLKELGYPEAMTTAILGHADYSGIARESLLAKVLYAVDELSGFITAVSYVRPTKLDGMSAKSVTKKMKDKAFAAAVNRDDIRSGAADLNIELNQHIANVIAGMQEDATRLGLSSSE